MPAWSLPDPRQLSPEQVAGIGVPRWLNPLPDMDVFKGIWRCWPVAVVLLLGGSASTALPSLAGCIEPYVYRGFRGHVALHPDMEFRARSPPLRPRFLTPSAPRSARSLGLPLLYIERHRTDPSTVLPTSSIRCRIDLNQRPSLGTCAARGRRGLGREDTSRLE